MSRAGAGLAAVAVAAVLAAGCSSNAHHGSSSLAAPTPVSTRTSAPSCDDQAIAWRDNGGVAQLTAIGTDLEKVSRAGSAHSLGRLQGAITRLAADSRGALANLPPACIPGMRAEYSTALHDFIAAGDSADQGTLSGIETSTQQITAGGAAIRRATRDLTNYEATQG
jgi:hypothetical protein